MWSDVESEKDYLNFGEVSQLAIDVLNSPGMLPISIGVFGNWGAGKSSLLKLIESQLVRENQNCIIVKFDAWLHQGYDDVRAALLEVIATKFTETTKENESLLEKAKRLLKRVNDFRILGIAAEGTALLAGIPTSGMLFSGISSIASFLYWRVQCLKPDSRILRRETPIHCFSIFVAPPLPSSYLLP